MQLSNLGVSGGVVESFSMDEYLACEFILVWVTLDGQIGGLPAHLLLTEPLADSYVSLEWLGRVNRLEVW